MVIHVHAPMCHVRHVTRLMEQCTTCVALDYLARLVIYILLVEGVL